jgi:hypothetical protein
VSELAGGAAGGPDVAHARHSSAPPTITFCEQNYHLACYQAGQLEAAYGLPALYRGGVQGQGTAIAIVDSFGSPTIHQAGSSTSPRATTRSRSPRATRSTP